MSAPQQGFAGLCERLTRRAGLLARLRIDSRRAAEDGQTRWRSARHLWPFFHGDER